MEGNEAGVLPRTRLFPGFYQVNKRFSLRRGFGRLTPPGGHAAGFHAHVPGLVDRDVRARLCAQTVISLSFLSGSG